MDRKSWIIEKKTVDNADELARILGTSDTELVSFQPDKLRIELKQLTIRDFVIRQGTLSSGLRIRGCSPRNKIILSVALNKGHGQVTHWWKEYKPADIAVIPPGTEFDCIYGAGMEYLSIALPLPELLSTVAREKRLDDPAYWLVKRVCRSDFLLGDKIQEQIRGTIRAIENYVVNPESEVLPCGFWQYTILECFIAALMAAAPCNDSRCYTEARLIVEVENFVDTKRDPSIGISEICKAMRIPRRTLYRAFTNRLGIGPMAYLRYRRLASIHSILKRSNRATVSIGTLASKYGFADKSRFAAYYRAQYGELPSQTASLHHPAAGSREGSVCSPK